MTIAALVYLNWRLRKVLTYLLTYLLELANVVDGGPDLSHNMPFTIDTLYCFLTVTPEGWKAEWTLVYTEAAAKIRTRDVADVSPTLSWFPLLRKRRTQTHARPCVLKVRKQYARPPRSRSRLSPQPSTSMSTSYTWYSFTDPGGMEL